VSLESGWGATDRPAGARGRQAEHHFGMVLCGRPPVFAAKRSRISLASAGMSRSATLRRLGLRDVAVHGDRLTAAQVREMTKDSLACAGDNAKVRAWRYCPAARGRVPRGPEPRQRPSLRRQSRAVKNLPAADRILPFVRL
jgi:hypothetical protein